MCYEYMEHVILLQSLMADISQSLKLYSRVIFLR
jgi:hypothetical protein